MEVICLEDNAFYELLDRVIHHIKFKVGIKEDKWVSSEEAMQNCVLQVKPHFKNIGMKAEFDLVSLIRKLFYTIPIQ